MTRQPGRAAAARGPPARVRARLRRRHGDARRPDNGWHRPRLRARPRNYARGPAADGQRDDRRTRRPADEDPRARHRMAAGAGKLRFRAMTLTHPALTPDDVISLVGEREIRFIRLWFTDILGQLKAFSINATELADAFEGGMGFDGSSITGFNAIEESDMIAMPDPSTFAVLPWRPDEQGVARMFCDIQTPERTPYEGDPRHVLRRAVQRAQGDGLRPLLRRPRARVLLLPRLEVDRGARRGRLLRPDDARRRLGPAPRDRARARAARDPHRVHPPRGGPEPARDRHALRRRAEDGRRLHDLPDHGQGVRDEVRLARDLHAQAAVRQERLAACTPTSRCSTASATRSSTPTTSTTSPTSARRSSPASSATRARSARSSPSGSTPTSASCPATRRRCTSPGRGATARRSCACRSITPARSRRRGWSCAAPTRPATRT